jgi:hypothetical protein
MRRRHLLEVNASVVDGRLQMGWSYGREVHRRESIEALVGEYERALGEVVEHCTQEGAGGHTPSDFPLAGLTQAQLERVAAGAGAGGRVEDIYPLSPLQQGILFHTLYAPDSALYLEQVNCTLHGRLDVEAFERAWRRVGERHAVLRTSFVWDGLERPLQVVHRSAALPWSLEDWRHLSREQQREQLRDYCEADQKRGVVLDEAPLMRVALLRTGEEQYQLVWSFHHLLLDGWSVPLIIQEVLDLYEAYRDGRELELAPRSPFKNYIAWLGKQDIEAAEGFWRRYLKGFTSPTPLVSAALSEHTSPQQYAERQRQLPREMTASLQGFARRHQLTLNTLVEGAWALLLSRYSGEHDVAFGVTVSGRPADLEGVEETVGLFVNMLPMRVRLDEGEEFVVWLRRLQAEQAELRQYEYSPLVEVQGWSEVGRGASLFESIMAFENYPLDISLGEGEDADADVLGVDEVRSVEWTNYPLTLVVNPGEVWSAQILFDSGRIDEAAVRGMLRHFEILLGGIAEGRGWELLDVALTPEGEEGEGLPAHDPRSTFGDEDFIFDAQLNGDDQCIVESV